MLGTPRRLAAYLAYAYLSLVGASTRVRLLHEERYARVRAGGRFVYALWHQREAFMVWHHRRDGAAVLVSLSRDGELIATVLRLLGVATVRGSSSRGGAAAALGLIEAAKAGLDPAFTVDGPRGPARRSKPGALLLAQKLGVPVLPVTCGLSWRLEFKKSWDRHLVPLPFGSAVVAYGEPILVGPADDLAAKATELDAALDRLTEEAEDLVRSFSPSPACGRGAG